MFKSLLTPLFVFVLTATAFAQKHKIASPQKPKLIVGIVVDQMRYDYLYRFTQHYGSGGIQRLMTEGTQCTFTQYNYAPTYTGPGHCAIYSGATPAFSGIAGNNWLDRTTGKEIYCVYDSTRQSIGTNSASGKMSPHQMQCTNLADQMKIASCMQAKVVGIALKDRGAILPAGHNPDAAYWFDGITGNWITSSYYLSNLPAWLQAYNALKMPEKYLATPWVSSSNIGGFHTCADDAAPYEGKFASDSTSKFPHYFDASKKVSYDVIRATPFGNTITNELAKEVIINEQLGKDNITDLIAISFSSPDYIGHKFGPQSHEIEDNYARFDKEIESLLSFLAKEIGKENVLVFLTADHGAAEVPAYMNTIKMPSGMAWSDTLIVQPTKAWLQKNYNDSTLFLLYNNQQIYLDQKKIIAQNLDYDKLCSGLSTHLRLQPDIYNAIPMQQLISMPTDIAFYTNWQRGIHPKRSGDIMVVLPLGWLEDMPLGTSHGTSFTYDTHVPLLWWGCNIAPAVINTPVSITDIAVTISQMLEIQEPDANMGVPILDLLKYKK